MRLYPFSELDFDVAVIDGHTYERFRNPATGYESRWNAQSTADADGLEGHTGECVNEGDPTKEVAFKPALDQFRRYYPSDATPWKPLSWDEVDDRYPWTHTTGPGARIILPPAGRYAMSSIVAKVAQGMTALRAYIRTQFKRPLSHMPPFNVREDLSINKGTPDAWTCDTKTSLGYNAFDPAHASIATEAVAAALGIDEAGVAFFMKYRILARGFPASTDFWFNQPRAAGYGWFADWLAAHLGLGSADPDLATKYLGGKLPKTHLKERIDRYCGGDPKVPYDPLVSGPADPRTMTVVGPFKSYGVQNHGEYVWQKALRTSLLALVASDDVLAPNSPQKQRALDYVARSVKDALAFFDKAKGCAWAKNRISMPTADALELRDLANKKGPTNPQRPYVLWPAPGTVGESFVAEPPITQDCALHALGWLLCAGKSDPNVAALLALLPKPGTKLYEPKVSDIVTALSA